VDSFLITLESCFREGFGGPSSATAAHAHAPGVPSRSPLILQPPVVVEVSPVLFASPSCDKRTFKFCFLLELDCCCARRGPFAPSQPPLWFSFPNHKVFLGLPPLEKPARVGAWCGLARCCMRLVLRFGPFLAPCSSCHQTPPVPCFRTWS